MSEMERNELALRAAASVVAGNRKKVAHILAGLALVAYAPGCGASGTSPTDQGSNSDATTATDSVTSTDTATSTDSATSTDASVNTDTTTPDATVVDAGTPDSTEVDAGAPDATVVDAGTPDATVVDATPEDVGHMDTADGAMNSDAHVCVGSCYIPTGTPCTVDENGWSEDCGNGNGQCIDGECHHGQFVQELSGETCTTSEDCSGEFDYCNAEGQCYGPSEASMAADECCNEAYNFLNECQNIPIGCTPWGPTAPPKFTPAMMASLLQELA